MVIYFLLVDSRNSTSNTQNLQIPLRYESKIDTKDVLFWPELLEEIEKLAIIVSKK